MKEQKARGDCVGIVEDDKAVREALQLMLGSLGIEARLYATARDYLDDEEGRNGCGCLIVDVRLPDMSGLELQKQLLKQKRLPAIIFISGHADVQMAVEAMRYGAIDFLQKPFKEQQLLDSVQKALMLEKRASESKAQVDLVAARLACLTARENDVLEAILRGLRTKDIAQELGISIKTAEGHRASIMSKMHSASVVDLVIACLIPKKCPKYCPHGHAVHGLGPARSFSEDLNANPA